MDSVTLTLFGSSYIMLLARNVVNIEGLKDELNLMSEAKGLEKGTPQYKWFNKTLLTWLINNGPATKLRKNSKAINTVKHPWAKEALARGEDLFVVNITEEEDKQKYRHIADYISAHPNENYSRIGVKDMFERVKRWDEELKNQKAVEVNIKSLKKVLPLSKFTWVDLTTKASLKQEGCNMGHCVGGENYWREVKRGDTKIFSLRDSLTLSKSFVTIEYDIENKDIVQIRGNSNTTPTKYYQEIMHFLNFMLKKGYLKVNKIKDNLKHIDLLLVFNERTNMFVHIFTRDRIKITNNNSLFTLVGRLVRNNPNIDLNFIDTSEITDMTAMFDSLNFKGDISKWDTSSVEDMSSMFANSTFNGDISDWDTSSVKDMSLMFYDSIFNGDISNWNTFNVEDMSSMFRNSLFNGDISKWRFSKGIRASKAFDNCKIKESYKPKGIK